MNEEKLKKIAKQIRDNELANIYTEVIKIIICSIIGAIIGYLLCKYNQYSLSKGIVLGIACPWGYIVVDKISKILYDMLEDLYNLICLCTLWFYAIIWFFIKIYISAYIGLISGPILAIYYIVKIKKTWKKDYSKEAKYSYEIENQDNDFAKHTYLNKNKTVENTETFYEDEKYYCEVCFKEISEEEYELFECMCEECFMDIHTDKDGIFREDYYKY